jgi:AcrR family transcriptional regulator
MPHRDTRDTRTRILDQAERLFAEQGISGTSLRTLTRAADVNLASVHYHFGSKEALLDAVVERRSLPLNDERVRALESLLGPDAAAVAVEAILGAFIAPAIALVSHSSEEGQRLGRLLARIEAQPPEVVEALSRKHFGNVASRFVDALQGALPTLPPELVARRFRMTAGLFSFLFSGNFDLDNIPGHPPTRDSIEARLADAIGFAAAGMRAPEPAAHRSLRRAENAA